MADDENVQRRDDEPRGDGGGGAGRWRNAGAVLIPAATFLVGIGLGAVVMMQSDSGDEPESDSPSPTSSATTGGNGDTVVIVPAACEDAAENISEAVGLLDDAAGSLRDFQPQELVDLLDQLEVLDQETRSLAADCTDVAVTEQPGSSESPSTEASESPEDTESP